jgi:hypothetical protein
MAKQTRMRVDQNSRIIISSSTQQRRIQRAQERARRYLKSGRSLVDELLAERRGAAKSE